MRLKHVGIHAHRLLKTAGNPEEVKFAEAWDKRNKQGYILDWLLHEGSQSCRLPLEASARDHLVAATVIQWLGSSVGQYFLQELGYEKKE